MMVVAAIALKELKILLKDPGGLLLLFILPALFILVLSTALQGAFASMDTDEQIEVLVVNDDNADFGKNLIRAIDANGHFRAVAALDGEKVTRAVARERVASGACALAVFIPDDIEAGLLFEGKREIALLVDPTFSKEATLGLEGAIKEFIHLSMLAGKITEADKKSRAIEDLSDEMKEAEEGAKACRAQLDKVVEQMRRRGPPRGARDSAATDEATDTAGAEASTKQEAAVDDKDAEETVALIASHGAGVVTRFAYGNGEPKAAAPNSVQQNVPGWTIFALFWIAQILCINILGERQTGAFKRVMVAPISFARYMLAKTIPFILINIAQAVLMFALGVFILPMVGCPELVLRNVPALVLLTLTISFTAIGFGLMMASLSKTVFLSASVSASVLIIMTALGGIMVPRFVMPEVMQKMSLFVPHGWALEGYLNILVKHQTTYQILPHVGALALFGLCFVTFAIIKMSRTNRT
jgi:ABC-2 type transport system permease protein